MATAYGAICPAPLVPNARLSRRVAASTGTAFPGPDPAPGVPAPAPIEPSSPPADPSGGHGSSASIPPSPPGHRPRRRVSPILIVIVFAVVIVIIVVALAASGAFAPKTTAPSDVVSITSISLTIDYLGSTNGYFGPSLNCEDCPLSWGPTSSDHPLTVTFSNSDTVNHTITAASVTSPFSLVSTSPSLPYPVPAGQTLNITFSIETPGTAGSYGITGTVYTD
jgi:hypothetical protein